MSERPPTRYDEEGKSLPERGVRPFPHATSVEGEHGVPGEPEKLVIPAEAVAYLLHVAVQNQIGNAWWNGFVVAHGVPSWIANGQWAFEPKDVSVVRATVTPGSPGNPGMPRANGLLK